MWAQVSFVLSQSTRVTDRQTDRQTETYRKALQCRALHYMQSHGKKQLISRTSALQRQPYGSRRAIQNPRRSHGTWQYVQTQHPIETSTNENGIAFYSQADHPQIRGCSYASSLPVTWQRWRSHHSIRRSRKSHAASKLRCSMFYRASYCRSNFCIARIWIFFYIFCSCDLDPDLMTFIYGCRISACLLQSPQDSSL